MEKTCEECGCPDGTTFVVRDIFYNVPARLKFLKKDVSEGNFAADLVTKLTLSHPEISFKFIRDNKVEILTAGDGKDIFRSLFCLWQRFCKLPCLKLTIHGRVCTNRFHRQATVCKA